MAEEFQTQEPQVQSEPDTQSQVSGGQTTDSEPVSNGGEQGTDPSTQDQNTNQQQSQNPDSTFAAMRRKMEEQHKNSAEYKLAQKLAEQYNMPADQMLERLEQQRQQQEAQKMGVDPQFYTQYQQLQQQVQEMQQQRTREQIQSQIDEFKNNNSGMNISDDSLGDALELLGQAHQMGKNDMTLEQAYGAIDPSYWQKRAEQQVLERMKNEDQNNPITPGGASPNPTKRTANDLTDVELQEINERIKAGERITGY